SSSPAGDTSPTSAARSSPAGTGEARPTLNVSWPRDGCVSEAITCQRTRYVPSPAARNGALIVVPATRRGPVAAGRRESATTVMPGPAAVTGSEKRSVIAAGAVASTTPGVGSAAISDAWANAGTGTSASTAASATAPASPSFRPPAGRA